MKNNTKAKNKLLKKLAQKYTVLYIEDNCELREVTSEFFAEFFAKVVIAEDGKDALLKYNAYHEETGKYFDIMITDIQMPNMDGVDLSREIIKINKNQKIIVVSAYNETKYFIDLIKIGISGFMQKPLASVQIFEILHEVCLELDNEREARRYIELKDDFRWDCELKYLYQDSEKVLLTSNEALVLELFLNSLEQVFTDTAIFNHINFRNSDKEFSSNAIKSLVKRLRKKIPQDLIQTHKNLGYSFTI